jgi:diguanylate cyclase (GGDEF)-like protein
VSAAIDGQLRACDLFGRLGGEEFAVLFAYADKDDALRMTNELRASVERSSADGVNCTLSAGVDGIGAFDTLESAIVRADAALYVAKASGRNRVAVASVIDVAAVTCATAQPRVEPA